ncbi:MAG TPA: phosphatidate cytidylyltransferase [Candidatus Aquicultor sp.]|jgi:phosphatidate cytidylyltransferase
MLRERVISTLVGVPVIIACLLLGKFVFTFLIAVVATIAIDELYSMFVLRDYKPSIPLGVIGGLVVVVSALAAGSSGIITTLIAIMIIALMRLAFAQTTIVDTALTVFGIVYVSLSLSHTVLLYTVEYGFIGVLLVFIGTWVSDIGAYGIGSAIGKRKIAPAISANKTLEGLLAGMFTPAVVIAILFVLPWLPFAARQGMPLALIEGFTMGLLIGIAAPIGDLVESRIKREVRVKDSGVLIPGHGGFMDRFDSLMFAAVVGYYFWLLIT